MNLLRTLKLALKLPDTSEQLYFNFVQERESKWNSATQKEWVSSKIRKASIRSNVPKWVESEFLQTNFVCLEVLLFSLNSSFFSILFSSFSLFFKLSVQMRIGKCLLELNWIELSSHTADDKSYTFAYNSFINITKLLYCTNY